MNGFSLEYLQQFQGDETPAVTVEDLAAATEALRIARNERHSAARALATAEAAEHNAADKLAGVRAQIFQR